MNKFALWCLVGIAICAIASLVWSPQTDGSAVTLAPPKVLAQHGGATLEQIPLKKGNRIYLQTLNLQTMDLVQIVGPLDPTRTTQGAYYPGPVLGVGSQDGTPQLMIATSDRATLENTAQVLRQRGVEGDLMTLDGGISTYLWSPEAGELILPKVARGEKTTALPHYLKIQAQSQ